MRWTGGRVSTSCENRQRIQERAKKGRVGTGDIREEKRARSGSAARSMRLRSLAISDLRCNGE